MKTYKVSFIYPLLYTLCLILVSFFLNKMEIQTDSLLTYGTLILLVFIVKFVSGIVCLFVMFILSKIGLQDDVSMSFSFSKRESKKIMVMYYIILTVLNLVGWFYYLYPTFQLNQKDDVFFEFVPKSLILVMTSIFCRQLLGEKFVIHRIGGLVLNCFGFLFIFITFSINEAAILTSLTWLLIGMVCALAISVKEVGEKWLMFYQYINPFNILLYEGTVGIVISFIVYFIALFILSTDVKAEMANGISVLSHNTFAFIGFIVSIAFETIFSVQTNSKFYPSFRAIADSMFCLQVYVLWNGANNNLLILYIGILPMLVGSLLYNEVLVFPFLGCDQHTRANIDERLRMEDQRRDRPSFLGLLPEANAKIFDDEDNDEDDESQYVSQVNPKHR